MKKTHITLLEEDIFEQDISGYDYVYIFLMPNIMKEYETRFQENLNPGTIIIANSFKFPNWKPFKTLDAPTS